MPTSFWSICWIIYPIFLKNHIPPLVNILPSIPLSKYNIWNWLSVIYSFNTNINWDSYSYFQGSLKEYINGSEIYITQLNKYYMSISGFSIMNINIESLGTNNPWPDTQLNKFWRTKRTTSKTSKERSAPHKIYLWLQIIWWFQRMKNLWLEWSTMNVL